MNARKVEIEFGEAGRRTPVAVELNPRCGAGTPGVLKVDFGPRSGDSRNEGIPNSQLVEGLARSELFREYQRAFQNLTGLPLTLRAVSGWQLAHNGNRHQNRFCALMSQANRSCAACLRMQQRVCERVNGVPCTLSCAFGLTETAVGVKNGQEIIAYLQTGQIFFKPPTVQQTRRTLKRIKALGFGHDANEAVRRYNKTPVVRRNEYQATVRLLRFFADQLGALANRIVLQERDVEPVPITRARQFIRTHYQEKLSLGGVARQVGMSQFYFCKTFKRVTGMRFTHYVCRVRVERARDLLLNPNYRVSEIGFEVGFQSLTHFNRVFKSVVGQSPTDYRHQLQSN